MRSHTRSFNEFAVREALILRCQHAGSRAHFAIAHVFDESYITDVVMGRRSINARLLKILGYAKTIRYVRTKGRAGK